jgi:hypothetical protein
MSAERDRQWQEIQRQWQEIQRLLDTVAPGRRVPPALLGEDYEYAIESPSPRPSLALIRGGLDDQGCV